MKGRVMDKRMRSHPVTQILGAKVFSVDNDNIGVIQNLLIDQKTRSILYLMLCYGDWVGPKNKYFLIPSFFLESKKPGSRTLILNQQQRQLMSAPIVENVDSGEYNIQQVVQISEPRAVLL